jgi:hypothetical protein
MSGLLFGAKVDSLKKLIQRTQPSDKMVQMLAAIQKHGKQKKLSYSSTISIPCSFTLSVHKTCLCDSQ